METTSPRDGQFNVQKKRDRYSLFQFPNRFGTGSRCALCTKCFFLFSLIVFSGCQWLSNRTDPLSDQTHTHYQLAAAQIEYPDLDQPVETDAGLNTVPFSLKTDISKMESWNLSLQEVVHLAIQHSKVMRDLGGTILRSPGSAITSFDPAIRETDPRFGVQAALSAFDTSFAASVFHQNNDRALNNVFFGGGTRLLTQKATVMQTQLSKQSASGTEFFLRQLTDYDKNNAPGNSFPGAWNSILETEFRQPLLRGYGVEYWQTVGSSKSPGVYNGVLIARTNTDISQSDFEISVRDFIADVENSYWDLYFAYRDLDAKIAARDASLELWRRLDALNQLGRSGGEADKEAQAREQYFRFQEDVQNALNGRMLDSTRTHNGSSAGTFKATGGLLTSERRLRYLIGLPINDNRIIRPTDEPLRAPVELNWEANLSETIQKRPELRRQKWVVKQKELELIAAKKLLLPKLDVVALYRWRGFGETLTNPSSGGAPPFDSALQNLASGRFQEWQLGVELDVPLGNRRAHTGIRNAEFQLARSRKILQEQQRLVVHDLSNAMSEVDRAWEVLQTVGHRLQAANDQVEAMVASYEADKSPVNLVLEAQRRYSSAKTSYYKAIIDYNFSVRNVQYEKGTYLEYCGVQLSEGAWSQAAQNHAAQFESRKKKPSTPYFMNPPRVISNGLNPAVDNEVLYEAHPLNGHYLQEDLTGSAEQMPQPIIIPEPGLMDNTQTDTPAASSSKLPLSPASLVP